MTTFAEAIDRAYRNGDEDDRAAVLMPVDDDGFYFDRIIPGDRIEDHLCTDVTYDAIDDVLRCVECDEPV